MEYVASHPRAKERIEKMLEWMPEAMDVFKRSNCSSLAPNTLPEKYDSRASRYRGI